MAMRHLWCACTKFQPNPASRRALSRSQSGNGSRKTTRIIPSVSNNQILKAMRKSFVYAAGLMCLALSITDCQKELVDQTTPASEPNFELFAQPVTTKTANNGLDTRWVAEDAINVFHAEAGSTLYVSDNQFTVKDIETGRFDGTVSTSLSADKSYDWYAFYPYTSQISTPGDREVGWVTVGGTSQTQTGNGSRAHLAGESCPLYGIASNVASDKVPSISMNHLTSVIKVSVTNNSGEDLTVSSVSFTGTEDIVGTYFINFAASPVSYKSSGNAYVSSTASLTVSNGEALANGSSADFYIALKPFTAKTGSTLKLAVNGYEKTLTLKNDITFTAGHIKPLNFKFDKKEENYSGNYVLVTSCNNSYWYMSPDVAGTTNTSKYQLKAVDSKVSVITDYDANVDFPDVDEKFVWTLEKSGNSYLLKNYSSGEYLTGADASKNYAKLATTASAAEKLSVTKSNGAYKLISQSVSTKSLGRNSTASIAVYAFYKAAIQDIYLIPYISLPSLATPDVQADVQDVNSVYAHWSAIAGAKDYTVTCGEQTVTTAETEYTFKDLAYSTEYTISVVANPSDETVNTPSAAGKSEIVKTGANPAGGSMTYTLDSDAIKAAHSSAWSYTSGSKTITAKDGSKWTAYNTFANKNQITIQMNKGKTAYVLTPKFDGKSITNIAIENVKTADGTGIGSKPIDILSADGKTTIASGISGETLTKGIVVDGTYDQLRIICNENNGGATYIKSIAIVVAD